MCADPPADHNDCPLLIAPLDTRANVKVNPHCEEQNDLLSYVCASASSSKRMRPGELARKAIAMYYGDGHALLQDCLCAGSEVDSPQSYGFPFELRWIIRIWV